MWDTARKTNSISARPNTVPQPYLCPRSQNHHSHSVIFPHFRFSEFTAVATIALPIAHKVSCWALPFLALSPAAIFYVLPLYCASAVFLHWSSAKNSLFSQGSLLIHLLVFLGTGTDCVCTWMILRLKTWQLSWAPFFCKAASPGIPLTSFLRKLKSSLLIFKSVLAFLLILWS